MATIVKPAAFTAATLTPAQLNAVVDTIYDEFGTTTNGQGNITDVNIAVSAAVQRTKVADTALVAGNTVGAGTQTVTRPTEFTAGSLRLDTSTNNRIAVTLIADGAATIALATPGVTWQVFNYANTSAANASIATITGGIVDQVYIFDINNADAAQTPIFVHNSAATVNTLKMKLGVSKTFTAATWQRVTMVYGDPANQGVNSWYEI